MTKMNTDNEMSTDNETEIFQQKNMECWSDLLNDYQLMVPPHDLWYMGVVIKLKNNDAYQILIFNER